MSQARATGNIFGAFRWVATGPTSLTLTRPHVGWRSGAGMPRQPAHQVKPVGANAARSPADGRERDPQPKGDAVSMVQHQQAPTRIGRNGDRTVRPELA